MNTSTPDDPSQDGEEDDTEDDTSPVIFSPTPSTTTTTTTKPPALPDIRIPPLPLLGQGNLVLDAATPSEHIGVLARSVTLAEHLGAAQPQRARQRGGAGPLDVFAVVAGSLVDAAHRRDGLGGEVAQGLGGDAAHLGDGGEPAVRGWLGGVQGQGLHLGEEDGVLGGRGAVAAAAGVVAAGGGGGGD